VPEKIPTTALLHSRLERPVIRSMVRVPIVLENLFNELNVQHFDGQLPLPRFKWNGRLSSSAGRFCPGSRNAWFEKPAEIEIALYLRDLPDGFDHIKDTMLHEMVHYYLWHNRKPYGHTKEFNRILKRVGAKRWNTVPKTRPVKYWYRCDTCLKYIPARRQLRPSACAACCQKYNGGKYHERFLLKLAEAPPADQVSVPIVTEVAGPPPTPPPPEPVLPASEIVRRLEEIKNLILRTRARSPTATK
jgi:predicted SprT family Zn-dependent metalloprotease